ncbi:MAG: HAD family hydrolase [Anaerolineae bacterium]|nr:HAD family hydrolase [Gloeobacterales cyanobacterium ES-bin-313]
MATRLIVFDLDGTLVDSEQGIVSAMALTVSALGLPAETVERWRRLIGVPLREQMALILPTDRLAEAPTVVETYRVLYREIMLDNSQPFPGVDDLLRELHAQGDILAICSGKRGPSIREVLAHVGWTQIFPVVISPDDVKRGKPDPESMVVALDKTGFQPNQAIMIGDTHFDIEMANRAGVTSCAVTWGTHSRQELAIADPRFWVDSVAELKTLLGQWLG